MVWMCVCLCVCACVCVCGKTEKRVGCGPLPANLALVHVCIFLGGPRWWRQGKALLASWITLLSFQRLLGHSGPLSKESLWPLCWEVSWLGRHSPQARTLMSVLCEGCGLWGEIPFVWAFQSDSLPGEGRVQPGVASKPLALKAQHVDSGLREELGANK